jgi:putative membrane protein
MVATALSLMLAAGLTACRNGERDARPEAADTLLAGGLPALTDGEVLHALLAATTLGSETAARGQRAAEHVDVETFAQVLNADHAALRQAFTDAGRQAQIEPANNEVSRRLRNIHDRAASRLATAQGPAFDAAFIQAGAEFYQALVEETESRLLPSTRDAQLRELLRRARPTFEAHLQRALQLHAQLAAHADEAPAADRATATPPRQPAPLPPAETRAPPVTTPTPPATDPIPPATPPTDTLRRDTIPVH